MRRVTEVMELGELLFVFNGLRAARGYSQLFTDEFINRDFPGRREFCLGAPRVISLSVERFWRSSPDEHAANGRIYVPPDVFHGRRLEY